MTWTFIDPSGADAVAMGARRQTMAADLVTRGDGWERGTRSVRLENDRVAVEVVVDRGMDIAGARVDGIPVGWLSPVPIVAPWFVEQTGFGPHRAFFGGLLTTGGLDHIGGPAERSAEVFRYPPRAVDAFPMHGRASGSPARLTGYGVEDRAEGPVAWVRGDLEQVAAFGENLLRERTVELAWGSTRITVRDRILNRGYAPSPLAVLYHVNAGWPLASPGTTVTVPGRPRGDAFARLLGPVTDGVVESVASWDVSEVATPEAEIATRLDDGSALALRIGWSSELLPGAAQWRLTAGAGHYAVAVEPASSRSGKDGMTEFPTLNPGDTAETGVALELIHEQAAGR
jgi:hypothetical protein